MEITIVTFADAIRNLDLIYSYHISLVTNHMWARLNAILVQSRYEVLIKGITL